MPVLHDKLASRLCDLISCLKGQCQRNHFNNLRVQKHICSNGNLQEVVHFFKNDNASAMKLKKEVISLC